METQKNPDGEFIDKTTEEVLESNKNPENGPELSEDEAALIAEINNLRFFTDQPRFNKIIYDGMALILEKLSNIEKLSKPVEKNEQKS